MGDRVLIQFKRGNDVSPVIYLHWGGDKVIELLNRHDKLMENRMGDVAYSAARFCGIVHSTDPEGSLSLGIWNQEKELVEEDSHGDAGCVVVDVETFERKAFGGYINPDGKTLNPACFVDEYVEANPKLFKAA